jgi:hypothetical protein
VFAKLAHDLLPSWLFDDYTRQSQDTEQRRELIPFCVLSHSFAGQACPWSSKTSPTHLQVHLPIMMLQMQRSKGRTKMRSSTTLRIPRIPMRMPPSTSMLTLYMQHSSGHSLQPMQVGIHNTAAV